MSFPFNGFIITGHLKDGRMFYKHVDIARLPGGSSLKENKNLAEVFAVESLDFVERGWYDRGFDIKITKDLMKSYGIHYVQTQLRVVNAE